jgi:hypothetical protein
MTLSTEDLKLELAWQQIDLTSFEELWEVDGSKVCGLTVDGAEAIAIWEKLSGLVDRTGYYPIVLGDRGEELECYYDKIEERSSRAVVEKILEESENIDADKWLVDTARELREDDEDDSDVWIEGEDFPDDRQDIDRDILDEIDYWSEDFRGKSEYTIQSLERVLILLIPTKNSWETFAFLGFGGWNSCPDTATHIAIAKQWYERYGAEVVGISQDTIEMRVRKPPLDGDTAFRLAQEQYIYCTDIVDQGVGSLTRLAVNLYGNKIWYFWWD